MELVSVCREILVGFTSIEIDSWLQATIALRQNTKNSRSE